MNRRIRTLRFLVLGPALALLGGCPPTISSPRSAEHEDALVEGERHMTHGRYEEAIEYVRPLLASQPRFDQARGVLIRALVEIGDIKGALEQLPLRYAELPMLSDAGLVYAHAGRRDDALRELERLQRRETEGYAMSYEIAIVHAALGQIDEACAALRHAPDDRSQTLGWLRLDPRMDPLRKEACYSEVAQRLFKPDA